MLRERKACVESVALTTAERAYFRHADEPWAERLSLAVAMLEWIAAGGLWPAGEAAG